MIKERLVLKKVLTIQNIYSQKVERIPFTGKWQEAFGNPQDRGFWFCWGGSGSGKSTFMMQLAKELARHYKVLYNILEEEYDDSDYIDRTLLLDMHEVAKSFHTQCYNLDELDNYLSNRNNNHVVIVDSLPYFTKSWDDYSLFKKKWAKKKIIIMTGHADGKNPSTDFQKRVMFDCKMKFYTEGYLATCKGRTIGSNGGQYVVWKEGYERLRGAS